jgi:uncharacterized protein (DUF4415 family)
MTGNKRPLGSNLARLDATTDEDIARQIAEDPDTAGELPDEWFANAEVWHGNKFLGHGRDFKNGRKVGRPKGSGTKELVSLRIDRDILDRFRAGGPGWQTRLNDALREVAPARSKASGWQPGPALKRLDVEVLKDKGPPGRPQRGTTARLIVEVLREMPSGTARAAEIRRALQSDKGVSLAFTSVRRSLGRLADRHEVATDDGKRWRYIGDRLSPDP